MRLTPQLHWIHWISHRSVRYQTIAKSLLRATAYLCLVLSGIVSHADILSSISVVAQARSDWIYHGTTENSMEPAIGINAEAQITPRFFAGVEFHEGRVETDQQRQRSLSAYIGIDQTLSKRWEGTLTVKHRAFPGGLIEWDYTELGLAARHSSGFRIQVDHSGDYYDRNTSVIATETGYQRDLAEKWYWYVNAGHVELGDSELLDYQYAITGGGISLNRFNIDVSYHWNSDDGEVLFGPTLESSEWVLSASYRLR